jgi:L-malate glycosyltransferase
MKKILIVDNSQGMTGAFKSIFLVTTLLKDQFEFHFAVPTGNEQLAILLEQNGFYLKRIKFIEISKKWSLVLYLPMLLINSWRLLRYIRRNDISIIHVNDLYNMTGVVIRIILPSVKLIHHVRLLSGSYAGLLYKFWVRTIGRVSDHIIVVSECVRSEVLKFTDSNNVSRIYDFIELEEQWNTQERNDQLIKYLYPANFTLGKGHEYAIHSFRNALTFNNSIRITFSGTDFGRYQNKIYYRKLLNEANDLVKQGYITFTDAEVDIERMMKEHDVLLNFSESESFSMTCYEASFYGIPVVVTDCGGPTEFVEHEVSGIIVPRQDVNAMSQAILILASNSSMRKAIGMQARILIRKRIEEENAIGRYSVIYESLYGMDNGLH